MNGKEETLRLADDTVIQAARKEGYWKGWNDRKEFDSGLVEEAINQSRNFKDFIQVMREKFSEMDGNEQ